MTRAILVNFRRYTPYGEEFYAPILDFFMFQMAKFQDEFDMLYLLDSNFDIGSVKEEWGISKVKITKVDPSLTYSDAYKSVLPEIKEDLVLFMDNDMVVYKPGKIDQTFALLSGIDSEESDMSRLPDVVSIFDTIGEYKTDKMNGKNKFCSYWFATRKELLEKYKDIDWNSHMPHSETLGYLTEAMLNDGIKAYEWEEDKSNILFDGIQDGEKSKDLGYYHIRAGSTPAYLLAEKTYGNKETYESYIKNQPKSEYLRQMAWYMWMCIVTKNDEIIDDLADFLFDIGIKSSKDSGSAEWSIYFEKFIKYHGLE